MDVLTRVGKIVSERFLNKGIKKPGLKFTPELALIGLRTTGPRPINSYNSYTVATKARTKPATEKTAITFSFDKDVYNTVVSQFVGIF